MSAFVLDEYGGKKAEAVTTNEQYAISIHDLLLDRHSDGLQETCNTVAVAVELLDSCKASLINLHVLFSTELDKLDRCLEKKSTFCSLDGIVLQVTFTVRLSVNIPAMTKEVPGIDGHT